MAEPLREPSGTAPAPMRFPLHPAALSALASGVVFAAGVAWSLSPYMGVATLSYAFLIAGLAERKRRRAHVPLMLVATLMDLGLVVLLEARRGAVDTALSNQLNALELTHVAASTAAATLYVPTLVLGSLLLLRRRNPPAIRTLHIRIALAAFAFRTIGFIFMFTMAPRVLGG